jgi:hypothetical protein
MVKTFFHFFDFIDFNNTYQFYVSPTSLSQTGLTKHTTRELVTSVTIGLTHSLSSTISHALSRSPKDDYYCHYCELHQLYCNMCKKGTIKEYELDYKISYYSTYYSTYYSRFFGTTISDFFASHPGSDQHNKGF